MASSFERIGGTSALLTLGFGALWLTLPETVMANTSARDTSRTRALPRASGVLQLELPESERVRIPRTTFLMGSTEDEVLEATLLCGEGSPNRRCSDATFANELHRHHVVLSSYWIDRNEVSVADYDRCVAARRCSAPAFSGGAERFDRPRLPVSFVSYANARDYCAFVGRRLPTEAEFERAARGPNRRVFPWGRLYNSRVSNHGRTGLDQTDASDGYSELAEVGSFPSGRTPDGIGDLAGNVAEWVSDFYEAPYARTAQTDPTGPVVGRLRVVRGGHYLSGAASLRGGARDARLPEAREPYLGFRCASKAELGASPVSADATPSERP
jgi:formylglycine-generating enzyme